MSVRIVVFPAYVRCGECGWSMTSEEITRESKQEFAIMMCANDRCVQRNVRCKLPLTIVDAENA